MTPRIAWRRRRAEQGSALVETTIIMPAYCAMIVAVIFFGNMLLGRQKLRAVAWNVGVQGQQVDDSLWQDVSGTFGVSNYSQEDPYDATEIRRCMDDIAMKHQYRRLRLVNGEIQVEDGESADYGSRFMDTIENERSNYEAAVRSLVNSGTNGQPWMARTTGQVQYDYLGDDDEGAKAQQLKMLLKRDDSHEWSTKEYLAMTREDEASLPDAWWTDQLNWDHSFAMMIRGQGQRSSPRSTNPTVAEAEGAIEDTLELLADSQFSANPGTDISRLRPWSSRSPSSGYGPSWTVKVSRYWQAGGEALP